MLGRAAFMGIGYGLTVSWRMAGGQSDGSASWRPAGWLRLRLGRGRLEPEPAADLAVCGGPPSGAAVISPRYGPGPDPAGPEDGGGSRGRNLGAENLSHT